ncbi:MAG: M48 family metallopeptidase [Pseudomonadota bacterium]
MALQMRSMSAAASDVVNWQLHARYFDGESAGSQQVLVTVSDDAVSFPLTDDEEVIWPLATLRPERDGADEGHVAFSTLESDAARLIVTDATHARTLASLAPNADKAVVPPGILHKAMLWGAAAVAAFCLMAFVIVPGLAVQMAELIPADQEKALGRTVVTQVKALFLRGEDEPVCSTPQGDAALARITDAMVGETELPYALDVSVVRTDMVNALAAPGGFVVLFDGLSQEAETPEEVAGVLAHEIGHVVARDPMRQALRSAGTAGMFSILFGDITGGAFLVLLTESVVNASYSREAEAAADDFALAAMLAAGLDPARFGDFFARLAEEYGESPEALAFFASHPPLSDRTAKARDAQSADGASLSVISSEEWAALRAMCG